MINQSLNRRFEASSFLRLLDMRQMVISLFDKIPASLKSIGVLSTKADILLYSRASGLFRFGDGILDCGI